MTTTELRKQIAGDLFLEFAVRDLIGKGIDETDALRVVLNTYGAA
jgi:hypothetical protein